MKIDQGKIQKWLTHMTVQLPALDIVLRSASVDTLMIGAGVFEIYQELEWLPKFSRKTGDLDLSVGLVSGAHDYTSIRDALIANGYNHQETGPKYRYFSPTPIPGGMTYIDLLAHPASATVSSGEAIRTMGAGEGFSFAGFAFAAQEAFPITSRVWFPNPFGMWALKRASYLDDPVRRIKDLADMIELASGLVEKGTHFDLDPLWTRLKAQPEATQIRHMLCALASGESAQWDIENARQELLSRNFSSEDIEGNLLQRLLELVEVLLIFP
ncbi:hypothetical protein WDW37_20215 [Bdellovibrionota bacterium FG-1]